MPITYHTDADYLERFESMDSEALQQLLKSPSLNPQARSLVMRVLEQRGETVDATIDSEVQEQEQEQADIDYGTHHDALASSNYSWVWLVVFVVIFGLNLSLGMKTHNAGDQSWMGGSIFIQSLFLTLSIWICFPKTWLKGGTGVVIRMLMLGGFLFGSFLLTLFVYLMRHGLAPG